MAIPTPIDRTFEQSGFSQPAMIIDLSDNLEDRAMIIEVLRSKLYADKMLAPIREYATNAFDSHVEAGCEDLPIRVTLPNDLVPEFRIRDFGTGLSQDEIRNIYIKYGKSTKRNTNSQVGQLGLGCKSAFAYGDNFLVISYKDGVKTTYNLTINGQCNVILVEPVNSGESNGIEIVIPVKQEDISEFQNKCLDFFRYWKIVPEFLGGSVDKLLSFKEKLKTEPYFSGENWEIYPGESYYANDGVVVMGNIPYPISWNNVNSKIDYHNVNTKEESVYEFLRINKIVLRVDVGDVDFSASRESLEYTEKTCQTINEQLRKIADNIFQIFDLKIKSAPTYWDALVTYNQIFGKAEDRLFRGNIYKLEEYFKGRFYWNDIKIESGAIEKFECWDQKLGYSESGKWGYADIRTPILSIFKLKDGKVKQCKPNDYVFNRIAANKNTLILIYDLLKPGLFRKSIKWMFSKQTADNNRTLYVIRFKDDEQKKMFFEKMHFESVPVTYISSVVEDIKNYNKVVTISSGVKRNPVNRSENNLVRCFKPQKCSVGDGWADKWDEKIIDMRSEKGFYVELSNGNPVIGGEEKASLSYLVNNVFEALCGLNETTEVVYAFPKRTTESKWFQNAVKNGQWINIEQYIKNKEDVFLHGKGYDLAKISSYFKSDSISIKFALGILPLLTNTNGEMYKLCSLINENFSKYERLILALNYFGILKDIHHYCSIHFDSMYSDLFTTYPMLNHLTNSSYLSSKWDCDSYRSISKSELVDIAEYVNMVDNWKNK